MRISGTRVWACPLRAVSGSGAGLDRAGASGRRPTGCFGSSPRVPWRDGSSTGRKVFRSGATARRRAVAGRHAGTRSRAVAHHSPRAVAEITGTLVLAPALRFKIKTGATSPSLSFRVSPGTRCAKRQPVPVRQSPEACLQSLQMDAFAAPRMSWGPFDGQPGLCAQAVIRRLDGRQGTSGATAVLLFWRRQPPSGRLPMSCTVAHAALDTVPGTASKELNTKETF